MGKGKWNIKMVLCTKANFCTIKGQESVFIFLVDGKDCILGKIKINI